jgi:heme-degrading monooxygenase HmoA
MTETGKAGVLLIVKGIETDLSREEMQRRYEERMPSFREIPGLLQKFYAQEESAGWAGIYVFESEESLQAFLHSDLRRSIAAAYEVKAPPQIEKYIVADVLRH